MAKERKVVDIELGTMDCLNVTLFRQSTKTWSKDKKESFRRPL